MREIAIGAVMLLLGLIAGGVGPRAELKSMMQTVQAVDAERCKNTFGTDLATFFGAAQQGGLPLVQPPPPPRPPPPSAGDDPAVAEALERLEEEEAAAREQGLRDARAALENTEQLDLARSALELRRAQSRQALIESADPDERQLEAIDTAYAEMNATLEGLAAGLSDMVLSGEEPDRRRGMEFAADALDAMLLAEDRVLGALEEDQRAELGREAANPFNHVSPALIDALTELDGEP
jgi:multidrug efflux pump subunit AcrA (membrane-fusion protein)